MRGALDAGSGVAAFLGIPFAEAPVGPRRWRPPAALTAKLDLEATTFGPACAQGPHIVSWYQQLVADFGGDPTEFPVPEFSEDCLYLNIWTPGLDGSSSRPVMVWIHGGSFLGGWSYEPNYLGAALARRGVVVVSIAYRLDVFGFFSHPDLEVSNYGLLDQIAALEWVQDHIRAFGGDPDNVTLFGESAGAASIGYLQSMPLAHGLFQRAIHQSGGFHLNNDDERGEFVGKGRELQALVVGRDAQLDDLRRADTAALLGAARTVFADYRPDVVVDGKSLTESPADSLAGGRYQLVDLLIGSNADEWLMYLDPNADANELQRQLTYYPQNTWTEIAAALSPDAPVLRQLDRLITAREFVCPSMALAAATADGGADAFVYYFSRVRDGDHAAAIGAYHGAEIPYVFGTHDDWLPTSKRDAALGEAISDYWVSFAQDGDPNLPEAINWSGYSPSQPSVLLISDAIASSLHPESALCQALGASQ